MVNQIRYGKLGENKHGKKEHYYIANYFNFIDSMHGNGVGKMYTGCT
jgi:hypothetical protein